VGFSVFCSKSNRTLNVSDEYNHRCAGGPLSFHNKKENVWPEGELQIETLNRSFNDGVEQICKKTKSSNVKARSRLSRGSVKHEMVVFKTSVQRSSPTILTSNPKNKRETLSSCLRCRSGNSYHAIVYSINGPLPGPADSHPFLLTKWHPNRRRKLYDAAIGGCRLAHLD
jgi:hypothetical protein